MKGCSRNDVSISALNRFFCGNLEGAHEEEKQDAGECLEVSTIVLVRDHDACRGAVRVVLQKMGRPKKYLGIKSVGIDNQ